MPVIAVLTILAYIAATTILLRCKLATTDDSPSAQRNGLMLASAGLLGHGWLLISNGYIADQGVLNLTVLNALSAVFWTASVIAVVSSFKNSVETITLGLLPISAIAVLLVVFVPQADVPVSTKDSALDAHILISLIAYAMLTLAAIQGLLLFRIHQSLHNRTPDMVRKLPPMEPVEELMFRFIKTGFILLTLALATGFLFLENIFAQHLVHKTVLSVISWILFAVLLAGRHIAGWRGKTAVKWTMAGFAFIGLAYFGTKIVLEWILDY
ncbi:MAG TPA: hypothetical protein ENM98_01630 [Halothiobacillaceae bacterium]|nr:hypothetical protein [Halothiobacillaceae bacterium]